MSLFQQSVIKKYITGLDENKLQQGWNHYESYFKSQKQKAVELKAEIDKTENEIDQMVYELYGLTNEEIEIVENATK